MAKVLGVRAAATTAIALALAAIVFAASASASVDPIPALQRPQLRHFSFFRTESEGAASIPPGIVEAEAAGLLRGCDGINPDLTQQVPGVPHRRVFVVPGDGCLVIVNRGPVSKPYPVIEGAESTREAIQYGLTATGVGVVPDGVIAVQLSPDFTVPVRGNAYAFSYRGHPLASFWKQPLLVFGAKATARPGG